MNTISVKDFKTRKHGYLVKRVHNELAIREVTIYNVGTKYVTIDTKWGSRYWKDTESAARNTPNALISVPVNGYSPDGGYLFLTEAEAKSYIQRMNNQRWISRNAQYLLGRLSDDDITTIRKILEKAGDTPLNE